MSCYIWSNNSNKRLKHYALKERLHHLARPIVRYQAKGRKGKRYWYYKWMSPEPIFVTKNGKPTCHQYLGKAGSEAYLQAVQSLSRRGQIEALERTLNTLLMGLEDLVEEAERLKKG